MVETTLFPVPPHGYPSAASFRDMLLREIRVEDIEHELTIYLGITELTRGEVETALEDAGYETIEAYGSISHLRKPAGEQGDALDTYFAMDEEAGLVSFYTNFRKTKEISYISDFLRGTTGLYHLIINPLTIQQITDEICTVFDNVEIHSFTAKRSDDSRYPSEVRPGFRRTIRYWGHDGRQTLDEMNFRYGALPTKVEFFIPESSRFTIDKNGIFQVTTGGLEETLRAIDLAVEEYLRTRQAFDTARFNVLPVQTGVKELRIASSTPVQIDLSNHLAYHEVAHLYDRLSANRYASFDRIQLEGSLYLKAQIIDQESGEIFQLKSTGSSIRLFPEDPSRTLSSLMRFYEFVLDEVDPKATVRILEE